MCQKLCCTMSLAYILVPLCVINLVSSNPLHPNIPCPIQFRRPSPQQPTLKHHPTCGNVRPPPTQCCPRTPNPAPVQPFLNLGQKPMGPGLPSNPDIAKILVERLISNPIFKEYINSKGLGEKSDESKSKVINNYFIVPKDVFLNETIHKLPKVVEEKVIKILNEKKTNKKEGKINSSIDENKEMNTRVEHNYPEEYNYNKGHRQRSEKDTKATHENISIDEPRQLASKQDIAHGTAKTDTRKRKNKVNNPQFPSDEYILNDFRGKFPHIPEEQAKVIIEQMKDQVQRQFYSYYQNNPVQYVVKRPKQSSNGRKSSRPRKTSKNNNNNEKSTTENVLTQNLTNDITTAAEKDDIESTTEAVTNTEDLNPTTSLNTYKPETIETTTPLTKNGHHNVVLPELGTEDVIPTINGNGFINEEDFPDFYPDFTFDNQAYFLNDFDEFDLKDTKQRSERKIDTKDSLPFNVKLGRKFRMRPWYGNANGNLNFEGKSVANGVLKEEERNKEEASEEVVFRIPPGLETPDFTTIQLVPTNDEEESIEHPFYSNEHYEKFSTYSEMKNNEFSNKFNEIRKVLVRPKFESSSDIETVFAGSKVINYAKNPFKIAIEESSTSKNVLVRGDGMDEERSIVLAKSIIYPDDH